MPELILSPATTRTDLVAAPVAAALEALAAAGSSTAQQVRVAPIDAELADTAAFCAAYGVELAASANCLVVAGKRGDEITYAACVVLATTRADVNGTVRKLLGARRASFAPMADAVAATGMEYGGITPIGLPASWRILIDSRVAAAPEVIVGAGIRGAKIAVPGSVLAGLPGAETIDELARPVEG